MASRRASASALSRGQSRDVSVFAFPHTSGAFADVLSVDVKDNPSPLRLRFRCTGGRPS